MSRLSAVFSPWRVMRIACIASLGASAAQASAAITAAAGPPVPPGYHASRVLISMRDGVRLETFVLSPNDTHRTYPILLVRTPYDPAAEWQQPEPEFLAAGYIFILQSVRGRYGSEGHFVQMTPQLGPQHSRTDVDASTDTFDSIDWLVAHIANNNGRVGLRGISYNGFYAAAGMIGAHPALKAVSPQAPQADWFVGDDVHHNGAFFLASAFSWLMSCDRRSDDQHACGPDYTPPTPDGYSFFLKTGPLRQIDARFFHGNSPEWQSLMSHGTYDELWQQRNLLPHLRDVRPAVLVVGGWYDANNLYGALQVFQSVRQHSPGTTITLAVGPWTHGQWARDPGQAIGPLKFGTATSVAFLKEIELPFFESHLKGDEPPHLPVARVFDTGLNVWRSFDQWPPRSAHVKPLYLGPQHSLGFAQPGSGADTYGSDPAHPVPFVPDHGFDMDADYMAHDQRFAADRPDVVGYQTEPLREDVTIAGPIAPHMVVSTTGTDSDFVVKLIDVHPEDDRLPGFQELVRGDVMRAKFRTGLDKPTPIRPGEPTEVDFVMSDAYHTFRKGHRIRVQVQSSWFPLVDLNPQRFTNIYSATAAAFQKATQRVYYGPGKLSHIDLRVLPPAPDGPDKQ